MSAHIHNGWHMNVPTLELLGLATASDELVLVPSTREEPIDRRGGA